jgi:hypothetical protein
MFKVDRKFVAPLLTEDDRHGFRRIDDKASPRRLRQRGRPASS